MAMIQKIRDNSALMLIVIGGALLAFILTEWINSSGRATDLNDMVGSFEGVEISDEAFSRERNKLVFLTNGGQEFSSVQDFQKGQFTNQTWNSILRDLFFKNENDELGITITREEEEEMLVGNPETGAAPSAFFVNYLFGGEEKFRQNRNAIVENISRPYEYAFMSVFNRQGQPVSSVKLGANAEWVKEFGLKLRRQDKLQRLLSNCFYTTTSLAKDEYVANNSKKDVQIAHVNYSSINDESVEPTEAEIKAAYDELKFQFVQKESSRKLLFARFDLEPSNEDRNNVLKTVADLKIALNEETDSKLFIKNETEGVVDFSYYKKGEYPEKINGIDTALFGKEKGYIAGPFTNPSQSKFGIAKVLDVRELSDSVKINRFVLSQQYIIDKIGVQDIQAPTEEETNKFQDLYKKVEDSLITVAKTKGFKAIDKSLWADTSAYLKGGELENYVPLSARAMGQNFMDSALVSKEGDIKFIFLPDGRGGSYKAMIQFEKFGPKSLKMQIGSIIKNVNPGDATLDEYMSKANQVAFALKDGKSIASLKDSLNYLVDSADVQGSTYSLRGLQDSRKIINWAFNSDLNQPSNVFTTPTSYVVAVVSSENTSEFKSLDDQTVKFQCEAYARKQKQKAKILESFPVLTSANFSEFPSLVEGGQVATDAGINLKRGSSKFGREFEVNGTIEGLGIGQISDKIEGEEGVFVVTVTNENLVTVTEDTSLDLEKNQLKGSAQRNGNLLVDEYITEKSDLQDNRKILR